MRLIEWGKECTVDNYDGCSSAISLNTWVIAWRRYRPPLRAFRRRTPERIRFRPTPCRPVQIYLVVFAQEKWREAADSRQWLHESSPVVASAFCSASVDVGRALSLTQAGHPCNCAPQASISAPQPCIKQASNQTPWLSLDAASTTYYLRTWCLWLQRNLFYAH